MCRCLDCTCHVKSCWSHWPDLLLGLTLSLHFGLGQYLPKFPCTEHGFVPALLFVWAQLSFLQEIDGSDWSEWTQRLQPFLTTGWTLRNVFLLKGKGAGDSRKPPPPCSPLLHCVGLWFSWGSEPQQLAEMLVTSQFFKIPGTETIPWWYLSLF